jgi:hypothetical protein
VAILRDLERPHDRIFHMSVEKLRWTMESAGRKASLEGIRFDDLRHVSDRIRLSFEDDPPSDA